MIPLTALPALNATLNAASALLLAGGYAAIRRRHVRVHRACMLTAFATSILSLDPTARARHPDRKSVV